MRRTSTNLQFDARSAAPDPGRFSRLALDGPRGLAALIDLTLLGPQTSRDEVLKCCAQAADLRFACVIVHPAWIALAHSSLAGSGVPVGAMTSSPCGASLGSTKREEALGLLKVGARELETVLNIGMLKSQGNAMVEAELRAVIEVAHDAGAAVKVILETDLLTVEEKIRACELAISAGADFLKTGAGVSGPGCTAAEVALLRGVAGSRCGVSAAGGIQSLATAVEMLDAGASRIASPAGPAILEEAFGEADFFRRTRLA
jgi:deoxyribose-phosphate aldolase